MNKTKADTLPESWIKTTLGNISIIRGQYGLGASSVDFQTGKPRYIRITDIDNNGELNNEIKSPAGNAEEWKDYILEEGDLLFARSGATVGKTYLHKITSGYFVFAGYLIRFKINKEIADPLYIFYFSKTSFYSNWVSSIQTVAAQPNVNASSYGSLKIPLPPLAEQKQIVAILQEADALRRKKKEILEKSNRLASALFLEMFGDPVRNEKGWDVRKIADVTVKVQTDDPTKYKGINYNYFDISAIDNNSKKIIDYKNIISEEAPSRARQIIKENDILISTVRPNLNSVAMIKIKYENPIASTGFCILRCKEEVNKDYLFQICKINSFVEYLVNKTRGANYPAVTDKDIKELKIALPPLPNQNDFSKKVEAIEETTKQIESSLQKMEKLYESLLQKAFTGKLTESWRKRNPYVEKSSIKGEKLQLQAFTIDSSLADGELPFSEKSPRKFLIHQLSNNQRTVLDAFYKANQIVYYEDQVNLTTFISENLSETWLSRNHELLRIFKQLSGIGLIIKTNIIIKQKFFPAYRVAVSSDESKKEDLESLGINTEDMFLEEPEKV